MCDFCDELNYIDNGYLNGYYCGVTGNKCPYTDTKGLGCEYRNTSEEIE